MKFLSSLLLASLFFVTSCSKKKADDLPATASQQTAALPNKSTAKRPSRPSGPVPRNPNISLPYDISKASSVTQNSGNRSLPYIAITFDDGPHPKHTPRLLDMLKERNIKATFYVIGSSVARHPEIVRRIVAEGHEIGNHTWSHPNLSKMSQSDVRSQLDRCAAAIASAAGVKPRTMRPPYGALRKDQRVWIHEDWGYPTILWDVDPEDWRRPGPSVVTSRITNKTRNGSIVLVHDLHGQSVDAMPATLDNLLRKGFKFVTVSQLIALEGAE